MRSYNAGSQPAYHEIAAADLYAQQINGDQKQPQQHGDTHKRSEKEVLHPAATTASVEHIPSEFWCGICFPMLMLAAPVMPAGGILIGCFLHYRWFFLLYYSFWYGLCRNLYIIGGAKLVLLPQRNYIPQLWILFFFFVVLYMLTWACITFLLFQITANKNAEC